MAAIEAIIKQLSVPVLKAELSKRGLQVKGKKDELVRIFNHDVKQFTIIVSPTQQIFAVLQETIL